MATQQAKVTTVELSPFLRVARKERDGSHGRAGCRNPGSATSRKGNDRPVVAIPHSQLRTEGKTEVFHQLENSFSFFISERLTTLLSVG